MQSSSNIYVCSRTISKSSENLSTMSLSNNHRKGITLDWATRFIYFNQSQGSVVCFKKKRIQTPVGGRETPYKGDLTEATVATTNRRHSSPIYYLSSYVDMVRAAISEMLAINQLARAVPPPRVSSHVLVTHRRRRTYGRVCSVRGGRLFRLAS